MEKFSGRFDDDTKKEINKIIEGMKCSQRFKCVKSGFEHLCRLGAYSGGDFPECKENFLHCEFRLPFEYSYICSCPLRVYISKKLLI